MCTLVDETGLFTEQLENYVLSRKPELGTESSTRPEVCLRHPIDQNDNNESLLATQPGDSKILSSGSGYLNFLSASYTLNFDKTKILSSGDF